MANKNDNSELWDSVFEPKMDEFAAMVAHLSDRFTPEQFRLLTGIASSHWPLVAAGKRECDKQVKRIIWFLYMLDTCPDKLLSSFTGVESIFMWGKNLTHIPKMAELSATERLNALEDYIRLIKAKNKLYSTDEIAVTCHVSPAQVVKACERLRYRTAMHNVADVYVAGSKWYDMDWRKGCAELSRLHHIKLTTVRAARSRLIKMPAALAARNILRSKNARFQWFYHLWDDVKQVEVMREAERLQENSQKAVDKMANRELQVIRTNENETTNPAGSHLPAHPGEQRVPVQAGA